MPTALETAPSQEKILLSLIQGSEGQEWAASKEGWKPDANYNACYWDHVICDSEHEQDVIRILIEGEDLVATIPSEFGQLHELQELSLPMNLIYGTIPEEVKDLPKLIVVNLKENELTGTFPHFKSASMTSYVVSHNQFVGSIPSNIGAWNPSLVRFDIMHNGVSGPIPASFELMKKLDTLSASENRLTGTIPPELGKLRNLRFLYLDSNKLVGHIPPQLGGLKGRETETPENYALEEMWLQYNVLSGTVPASIADLPALFSFYIDGNKLTGTIPAELCNSKLNKNFFKNLPETQRDYCQSVACPVSQYSVEGVYPCIDCPSNLFSPYLGTSTSCDTTDPSEIVRIFYESTKGPSWNDGNPLEKPWKVGAGNNHCEFTGITCDSKENIVAIDLPGMGLSGTIPPQIGYLRFLTKVNLKDNALVGYLPSDLRWPPLNYLDVTGNELIGIVPPELCFKEGINGNGENGYYSCHNVACPVGSFSTSGRGSPVQVTNAEKCTPCAEGANFLGSKTCDVIALPVSSSKYSSIHNDRKEVAFSIFMLIFLSVVGCLFYAFMKLMEHKERKRIIAEANKDVDGDGEEDEDEDWRVEDYESELHVLRNSIKRGEKKIDEEELEEDNTAMYRTNMRGMNVASETTQLT